MRYLLDTCVVSEVTKKRPSKRVITWLEQQDEFSLFLSVITLGELQKGISKLPDGRKRRRLADWVERDLAGRFTGRVLNVDHEIAARWGELSAEAERKGRRVPVLDGLLAATALTSGMVLATRNTRDAEATGVAVFDPWEDPPGTVKHPGR